MQPEIDIGPLTLQTFGLMFALAFIGAGVLVGKRLQELGKPPDWAYELIFAALVGGVVGARLDFMIENWSEVEQDFFGNLFSGSGLVWYGGIVGGALGAMAWARYRGLLDWGLADLTAPGLAVGYAIGRIGCQLSGDGDYGIAWDGPWAMSYPDGTVPTTEEVHPTPVYETLAMGAFGGYLWRVRAAFHQGGLFGIYLIGAGIERFLIEFIRRNDDAFVGLTTAQLFSLGLVAAGGALIWWVVSREGRLRPEPGETQRAAGA